LHVLGFAVGRCDGSGVQMIAFDDDWRFYGTVAYEVVDCEFESGAFVVIQSQDSRWQFLECYPLLCYLDPLA